MVRFGSIACGLAFLLGGSASAQVTQRASLTWLGTQGNADCVYPSLSADGRWVAFTSAGSNLVLGDTNGSPDIFVRDLLYGVTDIVSLTFLHTLGNSGSSSASISSDGRYVAFVSFATNLVGGDSNSAGDVFVRDRVNWVTERISVSSAGVQGNGNSYKPAITGDGRFVAFWSASSNLVAADQNGVADSFVRDRQLGITERVSVSSSGIQGNGWSEMPSITPDGRYVVFMSMASNLVGADTNGVVDVFVRDRQLGLTERVSVDSSGAQANGQSVYLSNSTENRAMSADGRYVAFTSEATNLVAGDTNGKADIFVRDRQLGLTERVSVDSVGVQANNWSYSPSISADGLHVAFESMASNLAGGDTNVVFDVYVRHRQQGITERVSIGSAGAQPNSAATYASISADSRYVVFESLASNLVGGDTNGFRDIFVRDRLGGAITTTVCIPGVGAVLQCPCSNPQTPPGVAVGGCDNSSATGGALLSAAGDTRLSSDSLVFTTSGQVPTTASILVQGTAVNTAGEVYGQGVRCVAGTLHRLAVKGAIAGSITVPEFGAGDPPVSVLSADAGDTILAGQSRWYLVLYRDAFVLGGCPPESNFNVTQTAEVVWLP